MKIPDKIERRATRVVLLLNQILDICFMLGIVFVLLIAAYSIWDSRIIYNNASPEKYEIYRPTAGNTLSFDELRSANDDVFAWLTIYGTNIDYPLVRGVDNREYLNKGPMKEYSLSGSIFEDYRHKKDLSSFNNLFYGHHMAEGMMFGDIDRYEDQGFFDSHPYGSLFCDGQTKGLEVFAFLHGDAADENLFAPPAESESAKEAYFEVIKRHAVHFRDIGVTTKDRLLVLSTCATGERTDRNLIVAKITDEVHENPYPKNTGAKTEQKGLPFGGDGEFLQVRYSIWLLLILLILLLLISNLIRKKRRQKTGDPGKENGHE